MHVACRQSGAYLERHSNLQAVVVDSTRDCVSRWFPHLKLRVCTPQIVQCCTHLLIVGVHLGCSLEQASRLGVAFLVALRGEYLQPRVDSVLGAGRHVCLLCCRASRQGGATESRLAGWVTPCGVMRRRHSHRRSPQGAPRNNRMEAARGIWCGRAAGAARRAPCTRLCGASDRCLHWRFCVVRRSRSVELVRAAEWARRPRAVPRTAAATPTGSLL
eukprot:365851-Chlamydomonas_euryale.AAC.2